MTTPTAVARDGALALAGTRRRVADFVALAKPRVVLMVVLTTLVGYYLGASGELDLVRLLHVLLGTALAAGGTLALNQFLELLFHAAERVVPEFEGREIGFEIETRDFCCQSCVVCIIQNFQ